MRRRLTTTPHALLVAGADVARAPVHAAREDLEAGGWETLVLRIGPSPSPTELDELASRYADCDLAVLFDVPASIRSWLAARASRPVLVMEEDRHERLVG